jgi:hypothetical protein
MIRSKNQNQLLEAITTTNNLHFQEMDIGVNFQKRDEAKHGYPALSTRTIYSN